MARSPSTALEVPASSRSERYAEVIADRLIQGDSLKDIAAQLYDGKNARRRFIRKVIGMASEDLAFQQSMAKTAKAELIIALPVAADALARRAKRGNPQALKLLFEASGFHNPRVKHDHTGEITVKMTGLPRPEPVTNEDSQVVDADVVE